MKKIYILLMHTYTIPSRLVRVFTNYEYSHVGISVNRECNEIYSFGRKKLNSILNGGFVINKKDGAFFKKFDKTKCKIYELTVSEEQFFNLEKILNDMEENSEKYKYDFLGIVPRFFRIPITLKNRYVCSYFVAYVLEKSGIYNFTKNVCLINPRDFEKLEGTKEVYQGYFNAY